MDIARIRKRQKEMKEADNEKAAVSSNKEEREETSLKPGEKVPEAEIKRESAAIINEKVKTELVEGDEKRTQPQKTKHKADVEKRDNIIEILTFNLLNEEFAFRVPQVEEILRYQRITKVPKTPAYMMGITSLRGKIIPVIDLKLRLSLTKEPSEINSKGKILIMGGPYGSIGAAIDRVISVVRLSEAEVLPPPSHLTEAEQKFIEGVAILDKRFISIIRMEEAIKIVIDNDKS